MIAVRIILSPGGTSKMLTGIRVYNEAGSFSKGISMLALFFINAFRLEGIKLLLNSLCL